MLRSETLDLGTIRKQSHEQERVAYQDRPLFNASSTAFVNAYHPASVCDSQSQFGVI